MVGRQLQLLQHSGTDCYLLPTPDARTAISTIHKAVFRVLQKRTVDHLVKKFLAGLQAEVRYHKFLADPHITSEIA